MDSSFVKKSTTVQMKLDEDLEFNKNEGQNKINMKFYEFILYCK